LQSASPIRSINSSGSCFPSVSKSAFHASPPSSKDCSAAVSICSHAFFKVDCRSLVLERDPEMGGQLSLLEAGCGSVNKVEARRQRAQDALSRSKSVSPTE
jgi:hypothetical protein